MRQLVRRRSGVSLAISIAVHGLVITALLQIVFRYPLGQLMGLTQRAATPERLRYVALPLRPTESSAGRAGALQLTRAPAALRAPAVIPAHLPVPPAPAPRAQAAGGEDPGFGPTNSSLATGIVPRRPDPRIALTAGAVIRAPRTVAEDVDSIVDLAIGIYVDSMAIAEGRRKPGDWTFEGRDGEKWGWDQVGIRLGKFTIPNALLALLPLNLSSPQSPIELRAAAAIRRDVLENAQRAISEDEFRAAVKRIRERKDREKRDQAAAAAKGGKAPPIIP